MSGSKHLNKTAWAVTALILIITILFMNADVLGIAAKEHIMGYENRLFDNTKVHTVDIVMNDWDEFIANATSEEYYTASIVIDGEAYKNVGIRGKGNTSLSTVSSMNSNRYSFKIEFDHYDNSITYHGLDKLSLNNLIQDTTMMKDYLSYTMMNEFGAASPLCSFVYITVNGEDWGLYLAVEGIEDSFLERNYGSIYGELYKPDSMSFGGGRGNGKDFSMDDFMNNQEDTDNTDKSEQSTTVFQIPDTENFESSFMPGANIPNPEDLNSLQLPEEFNAGTANTGDFGTFPIQGNMPQPSEMISGEGNSEENSISSFEENFSFGGMGSFGMGSSDVKLQYVDDNISSYSNIWNNAKTDITENDQTRLIESLQKLANGEQLESVVNIEQVIRYFVVHNYVCNADSYTGTMIHNYYLYEENGQMSMIPWDYNLAFGTFAGGNGQSTVNTPIDAPVSGGSGEDRPMWSWILSDGKYTELYHRYFSEFLNTVDIQAIIDNAYNLIKSYVQKDPTAFCTYEEFETGVATLKEFCTLRSESISMQLENQETVSNMNYVDATELALSDMGSMGGNGGFGNFSTFETTPAKPDTGENDLSGFDTQSDTESATNNTPQNDVNFTIPEGFDPSQIQGDFGTQFPNMGEMPEGFDFSQMPNNFSNQIPGNGEASSSDSAGTSGNNGQDFRENMNIPSGNSDFNMNGMNNASVPNTNLIWLVVSVLILGIGLLLVKKYNN